MNVELVRRFLNQKVKIVKENYALYGKILEVTDDCIVFESHTQTSVINVDLIQEITPLKGGGR